MEEKIPVQEWGSCRLDRSGSVYILTLTGSGDHRFNPSSLSDLLSALSAVRRSPDAGALITTNEGRYFSNGLDLSWIKSHLSPSSLSLIRDLFESLLLSLLTLPLPSLAALSGHASAGGFMLALAHDHRFMPSSPAHVLYMSELDHGMTMPRSLMAVVKCKLSPPALRAVLLEARKIRASEAFQLGIVDAVADDPEKTLSAAMAKAQSLTARKWSRESYANLRTGMYRDVIEELEAHRDPYVWPKASKL